MKDVLTDLEIIFRKVFNDPFLDLDPGLSANDVSNWDSLSHVELIHEVELHFDMRISLFEVLEFKRASDLISCIEVHLQKSHS